ncbi:MAG: hypothetical protein MPW15_24570 [Candidatus Manganitrophus sp.]|nr:hypothetical protein [Candidatus Manganitrophus sp.]
MQAVLRAPLNKALGLVPHFSEAKMRISYLSLILLFLSLTFAGCTVVIVPLQGTELKDSQLTADADSSLVVLYRNEFFGGAVPMTVALDRYLAGRTWRKTCFVWQLPLESIR